ncbi:hypothetical protein VPHD51_0149 [Vibrio phage D51]
MLKEFTREQRWVIGEYIGKPEPLSKADLDIAFLYVRGYGAMAVGSGYHQIVMAHIYAFEKGLESAGDGLWEIGKSIEDMAEALLDEYPGVAWMSNVGSRGIEANSLNHAERTYLKEVTYLESK